MVISEPIDYWNIPFRSWYNNASTFLWPCSKILYQSPYKIALKYWTQWFGGCGWVGFSKIDIFKISICQAKPILQTFFVNCNLQEVLCNPTYWNLWRWNSCNLIKVRWKYCIMNNEISILWTSYLIFILFAIHCLCPKINLIKNWF